MTTAKVEDMIPSIVSESDGVCRGRIPAPVVTGCKAGKGDALVFIPQGNGTYLLRKATAAERHALLTGRHKRAAGSGGGKGGSKKPAARKVAAKKAVAAKGSTKTSKRASKRSEADSAPVKLTHTPDPDITPMTLDELT